MEAETSEEAEAEERGSHPASGARPSSRRSSRPQEARPPPQSRRRVRSCRSCPGPWRLPPAAPASQRGWPWALRASVLLRKTWRAKSPSIGIFWILQGPRRTGGATFGHGHTPTPSSEAAAATVYPQTPWSYNQEPGARVRRE